MKDFDECICMCHISSFEIKHFIACCIQCPVCLKRFNHISDEHIDECKAKHVKHLEDVLKRTLTDDERNLLWS